MALADLFEALTGQVDHQPWRERAACRGMAVEMFLPERGESSREAKAVCRYCEVRDQCLEHALSHVEKFGIWGGKSERERRKLRRTRDGEALRRDHIGVRLSGTHPRRNGAA